MQKNKTKYIIILIILTLITFFYKTINLSNVIPGQDQISYIFWLQSLFNSERFFPKLSDNLNLINALIYDDKSWIHNLLKPIYGSTINLFTIVSLIYFYIGFPSIAQEMCESTTYHPSPPKKQKKSFHQRSKLAPGAPRRPARALQSIDIDRRTKP